MIWNAVAPPDALFLGNLSLSLYGMCAAGALIVGYALSRFFITRYDNIHATRLCDHFDSLFFFGVISGAVGGRALFVLYHLDYFLQFPLEIPALWHGGWVWQGGLLGGFGTLAIMCHLKKLPFFTLSSLAMPGLLFTQAIGRWGNYFNQETYGRPTDSFVGIFIDVAHRLPGYEVYATFHPAFFYESAFLSALGIVCTFVFLRSGFFTSAHRYALFSMVFPIYLIMTSLERFFLEFIRIDEVPVLFGLRAPQWLALGCMILGLLFIAKFFPFGKIVSEGAKKSISKEGGAVR